MKPDEKPLTSEQRALLAKHYSFYRDLDEGRRLPNTQAQWRFLAVCRGMVEPKTEHEYAYLRMKTLQAGIRTASPLARLQKRMVAAGPKRIEDHYCPRCARQGIRALMVWRTARNPSRSNYFLGCSRFPECRYIERD